MTQHPLDRGRTSAAKVIQGQVLLLAIVAAVATFSEFKNGLAVLLGGAVLLLPQMWFARRFFSREHKNEAINVLLSFWGGQVLKWTMSVIGLVALLKGASLPPVYVLLGLIAVMSGAVVAPLLVLNSGMKSGSSKGKP